MGRARPIPVPQRDNLLLRREAGCPNNGADGLLVGVGGAGFDGFEHGVEVFAGYVVYHAGPE